MSDIPPIPPNCDRFEMRDGALFFHARSWAEQDCSEIKFREEWCLFDRLQWEFKFAAICIARCAWLDEHTRQWSLHGEIFNEFSVDDGKGRLLPYDHPKYAAAEAAIKASREATVNAEAWRLWGEKK